LLSSSTYTNPKLDVLAILDECIAPSLCALRNQSNQNNYGLAVAYCDSLYKLDDLWMTLVEVQRAYDTPDVRLKAEEINVLTSKIFNKVKYLKAQKEINFRDLCGELEEIKRKLMLLLVSLND